jgi:hypothetical protein
MDLGTDDQCEWWVQYDVKANCVNVKFIVSTLNRISALSYFGWTFQSSKEYHSLVYSTLTNDNLSPI